MIDLEPGLILGGRYKIIKPIGAGGMGAVYLARDSRHEDFFVALKVLYPGVIKTREARERLRNEIVASYRVNHPNIVRAYEYFDGDDFQAYAMEYVDGGDLFSKMKHGPMPPSEVLDILKQSAAGLEAIHAEGIIHRDLKPENILLTGKGVVKITDFGVARLKNSITLTQAGAMVGTPKYLAPEYVETGECDHRGDIYATGVIGYEMVAGRSPFRSESRVSLMVERLRTDVESLGKIARHCPPGLARVIERCMAVNMHKRYQTATELLQDLERVERGEDPLCMAEDDKPRGLHAKLRSFLRPEPAIYGLPGARTAALARPVPSLWQRIVSSPRLMVAAGVIAFAVVWGMIILARALMVAPTHSFADLQPGVYRGAISGVLGDNSDYGFRLWRTEAGVFVLLGKSHCAAAKLDSSNTFECGELKFKMDVNSLERRGGVGTIQELSWGTRGTWSLSEVEGGEG